MRRLVLFCLALCGFTFIAFMTGGFASAQTTPDKIQAEELKTMLTGLGFEPKVLNAEVGKEKYEISITTSGFNIPVGSEISPSKRYIWLTVSLGALKDTHNTKTLLQKNGSIQPCFFYVTTKGMLMMAIALENRALTPAILKFNLDKITGDVSNTQDAWNIK